MKVTNDKEKYFKKFIQDLIVIFLLKWLFVIYSMEDLSKKNISDIHAE